jgi:hypothetical protein
MKYWPKSVERCANCGCDSERRDYGGRGYCCRCYRLIRRIDKIKGWSQEYLENLKRSHGFNDEEAKIWQDECISQLAGHLRWLHGREERYQGNVEGIEIEEQLRRIQHLIRPNVDYPRLATVIDHNFNQEQLGLLYHLLDRIEESIPWEGPRRGATILYGKVWEKIHQHREDTGVYSAPSPPSAKKE